MMTGDSILNGKCEYLRNCIARVKVEEDDIERKKREMCEESEEKERLEAIEKFRKEKEPGLLGIKRKRENQVNNQQEDLLKKPRMMEVCNVDDDRNGNVVSEGILHPPMKKNIMGYKIENPNKSTKTKTVYNGNQLALEYFPTAEKNVRRLALEYFPEAANNTKMGGDITNGPSTTSPRNEKSSMKPCSSYYILKLTEWKAWWTMVTRIQKLSKEALVRSTRVKSETEKRKFVKKYFDKPQNETKSPTMTTRPEKSDAKLIAVPMHKSDAQPMAA